MSNLKIKFPWEAEVERAFNQPRNPDGTFASAGGGKGVSGGSKGKASAGGKASAKGASGKVSAGLSGNKRAKLSPTDNAELDTIAKELGMSRQQFRAKAGKALDKEITKMTGQTMIDEHRMQAESDGRKLEGLEAHNKGKIKPKAYEDDAEAIVLDYAKKEGKGGMDWDDEDMVMEVVTEQLYEAVRAKTQNPKAWKEIKNTPAGEVADCLLQESGGPDPFDYIDDNR